MKGFKNLWNCKKNGRKKILSLCYSVCLFLLSLLFASLASCQSVSALSPSYYNVRYSALAGAQWMYNVAEGYKFGFDYLYNYEWLIDQIPITGNTANIHFETNVVLQGSVYGLNSRFHNTDFLTVNYCGSSGQNVAIKSMSISSAQTNWVNANLNNYKMRTLTIYADVVVSGFTTGTSDLYCNVGLSNNWAFAARTNSDYGLATVYFEQQPTRVQFTNDNSEAYQKQTIDAINNLNQTTQQGSKDIVDAINNQSENEKSEYQDQATQNESDINSDTAAQEQQATTLLNAVTSVIQSIKNQNASNCSIRIPTNLIDKNSGSTTINLCSNGYRTFINATDSSSSFSVSFIFSNVVMVVFLVNVAIAILAAIKKIYNLFLGGNS